VFSIAGFIGVIATIVAFNSKYYRQLSAAYAAAPDPETDGAPA
jgi:DHA3 family multidrug efflux protein-like MFS transporter